MSSFGAPTEIKTDELSVALTSDKVKELMNQGLEVRVQESTGINMIHGVVYHPGVAKALDFNLPHPMAYLK